MMLVTSCRYLFDSLGSAAAALDVVLVDARATKKYYKFTGLSAQVLATSGLLLEGELDEIIAKLDKIPGAVRYDE